MLNKSVITNLISIVFIIIGFCSPIYQQELMTIGFFAFSGAITNWLAVYMLFEKVPFLIGSGVIPNQFEAFKDAIKQLIMSQFFTEEQLHKVITTLRPNTSSDTAASFINTIDYDAVFDGLVQVILESKFGGMLSMFGGQAVLTPLKEPFQLKIKSMITDMISTGALNLNTLMQNSLDSDVIRTSILRVVDDRLNELTPELVKEIVQALIQKHLGWLVVWGGFFGGLIGFIMAVLT